MIRNNFASFLEALALQIIVVEIGVKTVCYSPGFSLELIIVTSDIVGADACVSFAKAYSERDEKEKNVLSPFPLVVFTVVQGPFQLALKYRLFSSLQMQREEI